MVTYPLKKVNPNDVILSADYNALVDAITSELSGHDHNGLAQGAGGTGKKILHANLDGLSSDDHPQYLNISRHDTTARHTLGTVVPHDSHSNLLNLSADDHPQYLNASRHSSTDHRGLVLVQAGSDANKPAAGTAGRMYYATDTTILYYDNGASWVEMGRAQAAVSHSALLNLSSDDHPQYLRTDGSRALTGNFNANGKQFINLALENLSSDPSLVSGRIWLNTSLGLVSFSPDGTSVRRIPYGTINVDSHASRHLAGGADALPWGSGGGLDADKLDGKHWSDLRFLYAGDETEKSVYGTTEAEVKFLRMINSPGYGFNITRLYFIGEAYVTGGTGYMRVSIDGASSVVVWTITSTSYAPQKGYIDVSWGTDTIHTISIRLVNSSSYYTYNRTIEIYVQVG
jgi:hypothetical protein